MWLQRSDSTIPGRQALCLIENIVTGIVIINDFDDIGAKLDFSVLGPTNTLSNMDKLALLLPQIAVLRDQGTAHSKIVAWLNAGGLSMSEGTYLNALSRLKKRLSNDEKKNPKS